MKPLLIFFCAVLLVLGAVKIAIAAPFTLLVLGKTKNIIESAFKILRLPDQQKTKTDSSFVIVGQ